MHELVIRGGHVVDGSGAPGRSADVAIDEGVITAVGRAGAAGREIDADGLLVTPGWVDMHTHYDAQVTWDPELTPSGWHGVTTVVMGNCGVGFAPVAPDRHDWLIGLMEGVEDIPGSALHEGIRWEWESFGEYLDALDRRSAVMDFATQVPHGALRAYVMAERGAANEAAGPDDLRAMYELTLDALRRGALGFSTSRTPLHKSVEGELVPGTFAARDELLVFADALHDAGHGVFQVAIHHPDVPGSFPWLRDIAARTGRPVTFNLNQTDQYPELWREVLGLLDAAHADGLPVFGQVAGRPVGVLQTLDSTVHPFVAHPTWQRELAGLDAPTRLERLRDPAVRRRLLADAPVGASSFLSSITSRFDHMWTFAADADYEPPADETVAAVATRQGREPIEVALDHLLTNDGRGVLYYPLFNYADGSLDALREMHLHPFTRMGLADAGAHCGAIADGGMPTFMVSYWTRDRDRARLPLEWIVHRQTRQTALHYGLDDRGLLAPGYRADLNVIDHARLDVDVPTIAFDLPADARRFVQRATGYVATICAGEVVAADGELTGATPGRLVRGPQPAPR